VSAEVYSAEIFAPDGTSQGSINMTGVTDDLRARELAQIRAKEWLQTSSFDNVTIQISRNGRGLSPMKVSR
jgi:hypothetical protein